MAVNDKPRVRVLSENTYAVAIGSHRATVVRTPSINRYGRIEHAETITIHGKDGLDSTIELGVNQFRTAQDVLAYVVAYFDAVDDALVYCDSLLVQGEELMTKTRKAFEKKLVELHHDRGINTFHGHQEGAFALCIPGVLIRLVNKPLGYLGSTGPSTTLVYRVGDDCVVDSYNLKYIGPITKITDKFVWCRKSYDTKQKRHTLSSFYTYNDRPIAEAHAHNAEERMYI